MPKRKQTTASSSSESLVAKYARVAAMHQQQVFYGDGQSASSSGGAHNMPVAKVLQQSNLGRAAFMPHVTMGNGQCEQHTSPFRVPGAKAPTAPQLLKMRPNVPPLPESHSADSLAIWNSMCWKEGAYRRDGVPGVEETFATPMGCTGAVRHPEISPNMRTILLDWMAEVSEVYKLHRTTYYMAADYVDRYLMAEYNVPKSRLQLIGITALFTASKIEEIYPPKVSDFTYVCDGACQDDDIVRMEIILVQKLEWQLSPMTAVHWLGAYLQNAGRAATAASSPALGPLVENTPPPPPAQTQHSVSIGASHSAPPQAARRNLFAGDCELAPRPEHMYVSAVDRAQFLRVCELLDVCLLDAEWTQFGGGALAAAAICSMAGRPELVAGVAAGLCHVQLAAAVHWMRPYAAAVVQRPEPMTLMRPVMEGVPLDDQHNIQMHTIDVALYDGARAAKLPPSPFGQLVGEQPRAPSAFHHSFAQ